MHERKKQILYNNALELFNEYLEIYFNQYMTLSDVKKTKLGDKYDPQNLFLEGCNYGVWSEKEEELTNKKNRLIKKNL